MALPGRSDGCLGGDRGQKVRRHRFVALSSPPGYFRARSTGAGVEGGSNGQTTYPRPSGFRPCYG